MRQLTIQVEQGCGEDVRDLLRSHNAVNISQLQVARGEERYDFLIAYIENDAVGDVLAGFESFKNLEVVLFPEEVIPFEPPISEAVKGLRDIAPRSPVEIYLNALQSIGRWPSFLAYAAIGAAVVWTGFFTNTVYLIIASMLISPFAGPAMNVAMASAAGDRRLLARSVLRYLAALVATGLVTAGLSLLFAQDTVTSLMQGVSEVSTVAALLPLSAGAVAALTLVQSQGSNLISSAATGIAVAASLAPPAGLIGISIAMGRWDILDNALFVLLLQLIGINLTGAMVFRIYGVRPNAVRLRQGKRRTLFLSLGFSLVALIGMLIWQFSGPVQLQRSSEETRAAQAIEDAVSELEFARLVHVETRFQAIEEEQTRELLVIAYLRPTEETELTPDEIQVFATNAIERALIDMEGRAVPLVDVTVLREPARIPPD